MKIHFRILVLLLLIQPFLSSLRAQYEAVDDEYNYLSFNHLKNDIFNENLVGTNIYEDADGYIWFSTEIGLCRFDGQQTEYITYEKHGLPQNVLDINSFCLDYKKNLWIGTDNGLYKFDREKERLTDETPSILIGNDRAITSIAARDDKLWLGTHKQLFLSELKDSLLIKPIHISVPGQKDLMDITCLSPGFNNHLFIGTSNQGLWVADFMVDTLHSIKPLVKITDKSILKLERYDNKHIMVATPKRVIIINDKGKCKTIYTKGRVTGLNTTSKGEIWCTTFGEGLFFYKDIDAHPINYRYNENNSNTFNFINAAFVDSHDNFWIIPEKLGIRWLCSSSKYITNYINFSHHNGLKNNIVKGVAVDSQNIWYIGTLDGLSIYNPQSNSFKYMNMPSASVKANQIEETILDAEGRLWLGTHDGLYCYQTPKGQLKSIQQFEGHLIWKIHSTKDKTGIWIGSDKGLSKLDFKNFQVRHYFEEKNYPTALHNEYVMTLLEDSNHHLWIGTYKKGLYLADLNHEELTYSHFDNDSDIPVHSVFELYESSDRTIWAGTSNGLYIRPFDENFQKCRNHDTQTGSSIVKGIVEDKEKRIWLITHLGISVIDPSNGQIRRFNSMDGMARDIFNLSACQVSQDGKLLAGSLMGLVSIDIDDLIKEKPCFPKTFISSVTVNNIPVKANDTIGKRILSDVAPRFISNLELKHDENNISITLGAIEFTHPEHIMWAYRIKEKDESWQYLPAGMNVLNFLNLPEGAYHIEYKSTNADGIWNEKYGKLSIVILPHWSNTTLAYWIYFLFTMLLFISILKYREHKIKIEDNIAKERAMHKQTLELEEDKLDFFTNISHELRTPLTLISAPLDELRSKIDQLTSEKKKTYLELINSNVLLLNKLINQLLEFRKIQDGKAQLHLSYHRIGELVKSAIDNFKGYASHQKIALNFICDTNIDYVVCDNDAIEKILYNLISNAIKYTEEGGHITVRVFTDSHTPGFYCISVRDTGIGIAKNQQNEVFKRFLRLSKDGEKISGIGIGLAFTKALVEMHKGKIELDSVEHKGSCFTVYLPSDLKAESFVGSCHTNKFPPITEHPLSLNFTQNSEEGDNSRETLLIVEDNVELQIFLCEFFKSKFSILLGKNGEEGLTIAMQTIPDIILTDVMMPEMDGIEMTRKIKANLLTSHIPVVMLTAKAEIQDETEGLEAGADYFLTKPFHPKQLELIIDNIHRHQELMRKHLLRKHDKASDKPNIDEIKEDRFLQELKAIIEKYLDSPELNIDVLAKEMNISCRQLFRKIKATGNITPNDFIRNIRLEKAIDLLNKKEMNISEIAYAIGYSDPKYFSKCFKSVYGVSPSAYCSQNKPYD